MSELRDHAQVCEHGYFQGCLGGEPYRGDLPRKCPGGRLLSDPELLEYLNGRLEVTGWALIDDYRSLHMLPKEGQPNDTG